MKKLMTIAILGLALIEASAFATSIKPEKVGAEFTRMKLDSQLNYGEIIGGSIAVDYYGQQAKLTLDPQQAICAPESFACPRYYRAPIQIELPITSVTTDACGVIHIEASKDLRAVDGDLQQLFITDYSETRCRYLVIAPTVVEYKTLSAGMGGNIVVTTSSFYANQLEALPELN